MTCYEWPQQKPEEQLTEAQDRGADNPKHWEMFIRNNMLQSRGVRDAHLSLISPFFRLPCAMTRTTRHSGGSGGPQAAHEEERFCL